MEKSIKDTTIASELDELKEFNEQVHREKHKLPRMHILGSCQMKK